MNTFPIIRHIKMLEIEKGRLDVDTEHYSGLLAECRVHMDVIQTETNPMPAFPDCPVISERLCITLCSDMTFYRALSDPFMATIKGFTITVDVPRKDGTYERIVIKNPEPKGIIRNGEWKFEITDQAMIEKIVNI